MPAEARVILVPPIEREHRPTMRINVGAQGGDSGGGENSMCPQLNRTVLRLMESFEGALGV